MERGVDFLVKELKVCTQKEANERIFFVSAKEALQARLLDQKGQPAHGKNKTTVQLYWFSMWAICVLIQGFMVEEGKYHMAFLYRLCHTFIQMYFHGIIN
jgi:hypothetical protein